MAMGPNADSRLMLVVDHDPESRLALRRALVRRGYDVVNAGSGVVALELVQRMGERFRAVLVDLELPGISGVVVAETLRRFRPEVPVVCMRRALASRVAGAAGGCLSKPIDEDELAALVEAACARRASNWVGDAGAPTQAVELARARFEATGDLVEAAFELAKGMPEEP
jgi:DNA-binding response OmpR family regulator